MSSLFATLGTAASSLDVLQQAIAVVQNNVTNSTTPGYVTQTLELASKPFNLADNLVGGVETPGVQSARDVFAEQSVWSANEQSGFSSQQSATLNSLQQVFDVSGKNGVPGALSNLFSAFSAWSASPSSLTAQQSVLTAAQGVASAFNQTVSQVQQIGTDNTQQLSSSVTQLNQYTSQVAKINTEIRTSAGSGSDAGLQAQLYSTLEQISNLAPITVNFESDGTATVLLGGQSPLVQGTTQNNVSLTTNPSGSPVSTLSSSDGHNITSLFTQGKIGGALAFNNTTLPSIIGDGGQTGSLNQLAKGVADDINGILKSGQISTGPPAVPGVPLFSYTASPATGIASSLSVVANLQASQLAAISPGPPAVANGTASQLASLVNPSTAAGMIGNYSFTQFYGNVASNVGQQASTASSDDTVNTNILNQAQTLRAQVSGVSLNAQAANLLQFQESYQASAQLITTINTMTQSLLTAMQQVSG